MQGGESKVETVMDLIEKQTNPDSSLAGKHEVYIRLTANVLHKVNVKH